MRTPTFFATLAASLALTASPLWAQTAAPVAPARMLPAETPQNTQPSSSNQLIERIRVETADVRIDEVRFGGETRSISVAPKGGFPAYDVKPATGERTWKVLGF